MILLLLFVYKFVTVNCQDEKIYFLDPFNLLQKKNASVFISLEEALQSMKEFPKATLLVSLPKNEALHLNSSLVFRNDINLINAQSQRCKVYLEAEASIMLSAGSILRALDFEFEAKGSFSASTNVINLDFNSSLELKNCSISSQASDFQFFFYSYQAFSISLQQCSIGKQSLAGFESLLFGSVILFIINQTWISENFMNTSSFLIYIAADKVYVSDVLVSKNRGSDSNEYIMFMIESRDVLINSSHFSLNSDILNLVLLSNYFETKGPEVMLTYCSFQSNFMVKSLLSFRWQIVKVAASNCKFLNNTGPESLYIFTYSFESISITNTAFILNDSPYGIVAGYSRFIELTGLLVIGSIEKKFKYAGTPVWLENVLQASVTNTSIFFSKSSGSCPGLVFFHSTLANEIIGQTRAYEKEIILQDVRLFNFSFVKEFTGNAYNSGALFVQTLEDYKVILSNILLQDHVVNSDKYYLVIIICKLSEVTLENFVARYNKDLYSIVNLNADVSKMINCVFANNTGISINIINVVSNFIFEMSNVYVGNKVFVSMVQYNPFERLVFQYLFLSKVAFHSNTVELFGGAIAFSPTFSGNYSIVDCLFLNCLSKYMAGGIDIFCTNSLLQPSFYILINCTFANNYASFEGGGLSFFFHDSGYYSYMINCTMTKNFGGKGGAIMLSMDTNENLIFFLNCHWEENAAEGGGALSTVSGKVLINNNIFISNKALRAGSIEAINYNNLFIFYSNFVASSADKYGGCFLSVDNSNLNLSSVKIMDCYARYGGAFYLDAYSNLFLATVLIENCAGDVGVAIFESKSQKESSLENLTVKNINANRSVIFLDLSKFKIRNCSFQDMSASVFFAGGSQIDASSLLIQNVTCMLDGCVFKAHAQSDVRIAHSLIRNIYSAGKGGGFFLQNSKLAISGGTAISEINCRSRGGLIFAEEGAFELFDVIIRKVTQDLVKAVALKRIVLSSVIFNNLAGDRIAAFSYLDLDSCPYLLVNASEFSNLGSNSNGGFMSLINSRRYTTVTHLITNSLFVNISSVSGGALYLENDDLRVENTRFQNISARLNGGAISYFCDPPESTFCQLYLVNCSFLDNKAGNHGGAISWKFQKPLGIDSCQFQGNRAANYGDDVSSFPVLLQLLVMQSSNLSVTSGLPQVNPSKFFILNNIQSGLALPFILNFTLIDEINQTVRQLPEAKAYIDLILKDDSLESKLSFHYNISTDRTIQSFTSNTRDISGQTSLSMDPSTNSFEFDDIVLTATPSSTVFLKVTTSEIGVFRKDLIKYSISVNHYAEDQNGYMFIVPIRIRPCSEGEVYDNTSNTCYKCPNGTFSLEKFATRCFDCLENCVCPGGNIISLKHGYWRTNNLSLLVYRCSITLDSCLGGANSLCSEGYEGPLCDVCTEKSGARALKNYFGFCQNCEFWELSFLFIFIILLIFFVLLRQFKRFIIRAKKHFVFNAGLLKLLIIHVQTLSLVPNSNINMDKTPNRYFGALTRNIFSLDCLFVKIIPLESFLNSRLLNITIFLIVLVAVSNLAFIKLKKMNGEFNSEALYELITYNTLFLFMIQSSMVDQSFLGIRCINIEGISYMRFDMKILCWSGEHVVWIIFLYLPNILFWVVALPVIYYHLYKIVIKQGNRHRIINASVGFKKKYKFRGDLLNNVRKIIIIIVVSSFYNENSTTTALIVVTVMSILFIFQLSARPYNYKGLNLLDAFSLFTNFFTYYAICYYYTSSTRVLSDFFSLVVLLLNVFFFIFWSLGFFRKGLTERIQRCWFSKTEPKRRNAKLGQVEWKTRVLLKGD